MLRGEGGSGFLVLNFNDRLVVVIGIHFVREVLDVLEHTRGSVALANHSFDLEDGVLWIAGGLILGRITHETLGGSEGHAGRGDVVTLLVGDDLGTTVLHAETVRTMTTQMRTRMRTFVFYSQKG